MAIIFPSLGNIKGKMQGATFQLNPAGNVLRSTPRPRRSSTPRQQGIHSAHQNFIQLWRGLSLSDQTAWNDYATAYTRVNKWGEEKTVTGFNWFETINQNAAYIDAGYFSTPPSHDVPAGTPDFEVERDDTTLVVHLLESVNFTEVTLVVWGSPATMRSSNSLRRLSRKLQPASIAPSDRIDIKSSWETATGLTYSPDTCSPNARVQICLQAVWRLSGIDSPLLCTLDSVPPE